MLCYFNFLLFFFLLYYTMCLPFSPVLNTLLLSFGLFHSLLWMSLNVLLHIFLNTLLQEFSPLKYTVTLFFFIFGRLLAFLPKPGFPLFRYRSIRVPATAATRTLRAVPILAADKICEF